MVKSCQLSSRKVSTVRKPGYYGDGGGLYLQVSQYGTKSWVFRFALDGRTRDMGLGSLDTFTLKEARERARKFRQLVADGVDPIEDRLTRRDEARAEAFGRLTFKEAAQRFIELHAPTWKNEKHRKQWASTLEAYAYRTLGSRPVSAIDGAAITEVLSPIWLKKQETASRTKQRIERVVQWVKNGMPLPQQGATRRVRHHPALIFAELPEFMAELSKNGSVTAGALEFTILTAARTSETIGAKWSEIDLNARVWTVPAVRVKGGKEHEVPLSKRALAILENLPREPGGYVFPGARARAPMSNMTMLKLLKGMRGGITVHGFRACFRDWAGDRTNFAREVIEHALAHQIKDKAEAAYRRSAALEKRRRLMEAWAKYCSSPPARVSGEVVSLRSA